MSEPEVVKTNKSTIYPCNCTKNSHGNTAGAAYQDKVLGKGQRYYTDGGPTGKKRRCTVCGKERVG